MSFHLKDMLGALVEDDGAQQSTTAKHQAVVAAKPQPAPEPVLVSMQQPAAVSPDIPADHQDDSYQRLLECTDFTKTPVYRTINKYLAPIASLALDEKTKFKIALQQAQAQDGLTADAIQTTFGQLHAALESASEAVAKTAAAITASEVDGKKQAAADLGIQLQKLQSQIAQLTEESFAAQQKLQTAQHRFDIALETRKQELLQEQAKYAGLLA